MDHEDYEDDQESYPPNPGWSAEPYDGSPSTTFATSTACGSTALITSTDSTQGPQKGTPTAAPPGLGTISTVPTTAEFVKFYDTRTLPTDLLLVSFIPDDVSHTDFCDTMDRIQRHLKVQHINNYYQTTAYATKFPPAGPASWADDGISYPEERHNSFLLRLGGKLPFSATGHPTEHTRPLFFLLPLSPVQETRPNRWLVIQAVPTNFAKLFLRPPMAVWRGVGLDASMGNGAAALQLVTLYVASAVNAWRVEDPNCNWTTFSYLSSHIVDIKPPPKPRTGPALHRQERGGGRSSWNSGRNNTRRPPSPPPSPDTGGPTQAQYGELFLITVCTAPIGRISACFDSLIPQSAAYGLPTYPVRLCGWWLEFARGLDTFRTNEKKVAPSMELLSPCPTLRIKGLKAGATLGRIIEALGTDSQDASGIQSGFLHRAPGGDSCTLLTTGPRLLGTPALRPLASSLTPQDDADIEDLRRLRERYGIFRRSLGLPTTTTEAPTPNPPPPGDMIVALRVGKPPPPTTFNEIVRALPSTVGDQLRTFVREAIQQEVALLNQQTLARVEELATTQRQQGLSQEQQAAAMADIPAEQARQSNALLDLDAGHELLRDSLQEQAAEVQNHRDQFTGLQAFLERQDARWTRIESNIQTLFKRKGSDLEDDGPLPPPSPGPGNHQY